MPCSIKPRYGDRGYRFISKELRNLFLATAINEARLLALLEITNDVLQDFYGALSKCLVATGRSIKGVLQDFYGTLSKCLVATGRSINGVLQDFYGMIRRGFEAKRELRKMSCLQFALSSLLQK